MADEIEITFKQDEGGIVAVYNDSSHRENGEILPLNREGVHYDTLMYLCRQMPSEVELPADFPQIIGENLYEFLFAGNPTARSSFRAKVTGEGSVCVRLEFKTAAWGLAGLPWEFLFVPVDAAGYFVAAAPKKELVLTRHVPSQPPLRGRRATLKVLIAVASPESERAEIDPIGSILNVIDKTQREALGRKEQLFQTYEVVNEDWDKLKKEIEDYQPDIVHFRGHGEHGAVWFAAAEPAVQAWQKSCPFAFTARAHDAGVLTTPKAVQSLFGKVPPDLVVLDACETGMDCDFLPGIAHLLVQDVPAVVAMRYKISLEASKVFMTELYTRIATGDCLDVAVRMARIKLAEHVAETKGTVYSDRAFGFPVLYLGDSEPLLEVSRPQNSGRGIPGSKQPRQTRRMCPRCGKGYWAGKFCEVCGLPFWCPHCTKFRFKTPLEANFCGHCGEPTKAPPWPPDEGKPDEGKMVVLGEGLSYGPGLQPSGPGVAAAPLVSAP